MTVTLQKTNVTTVQTEQSPNQLETQQEQEEEKTTYNDASFIYLVKPV